MKHLKETRTKISSSLILEFVFANGHAYMMTIKEDSRLLELLLALEKDMQRYVY